MMEMLKTFERTTVVFHYNKKHNEDQTIPPYVLKVKGESYYVHHIDSSVGFSTKETPNNPHTKGSLKFVGRLTICREDDTIVGKIS